GILFLFFFQAEDGIRDRNVTGVQTCALPIYCSDYGRRRRRGGLRSRSRVVTRTSRLRTRPSSPILRSAWSANRLSELSPERTNPSARPRISARSDSATTSKCLRVSTAEAWILSSLERISPRR